MRRALLIAYDFPPVNAGGSMRPLRLSNHLVRGGAETVVVTSDPDGRERTTDDSLLRLVDGRIRVHRVPLQPSVRWRPLRRLIQSGYTGQSDEIASRWLPNLQEALEQVCSGFDPDVVFITMPPFSLHKLVLKMGDIAPRAAIVADLRDAWSQWCLTPFPSFFHYIWCLYKERRTLRAADLALVTSPVTRDDLLRLHPQIEPESLLFAPNSFDQYCSPSFSNLDTSKSSLELLYVGSFYFDPALQRLHDLPWYRKKPHQFFQFSPRREDWSYRGPEPLLRILDLLLQSEDLQNRLKVTFAGKKPKWWESVITTSRLETVCEHIGMLSNEQVLERIDRCDALLVTSSKVVGGRDYSIAGKTYEYFAARKPIVGVVAQGAQKDILAGSGMALCLDPDTPEESATVLGRLLSGELTLAPNEEFLRTFTTEHVCSRILSQLESRF